LDKYLLIKNNQSGLANIETGKLQKKVPNKNTIIEQIVIKKCSICERKLILILDAKGTTILH
jgi:hypothetical protein